MESAPIGAKADVRIALRAREGDPVEHVVVANNGWYLFNSLPLVCGNARTNASFRLRFFRDDVDLTILQERLSDLARNRGLDIAEENIFNDEQVLLSLPGFEIPLPYIITYREMQLSSLLVSRNAASAEKGPAK